MIRCQKCDHFSMAGATVCERCGQVLTAAEPASSPPAESIDAQVLATAAEGGKIAAIKLYREKTGMGLKDAKEAVERLMAQHNVKAASGCAGMLAFLTLTGLAFGAFAALAVLR